jgi:hypothetical protein
LLLDPIVSFFGSNVHASFLGAGNEEEREADRGLASVETGNGPKKKRKTRAHLDERGRSDDNGSEGDDRRGEEATAAASSKGSRSCCSSEGAAEAHGFAVGDTERERERERERVVVEEEEEGRKEEGRGRGFFEKREMIQRSEFFFFCSFFFSLFSSFSSQKHLMAANALDTVRLIGKTLVTEYNAKTPSRLKVRRGGRREKRKERGERERDRSMGDRMLSLSRSLPRALLTRRSAFRSRLLYLW